MRCRSRQNTICAQRSDLARLRADKPSLRTRLPDVITQVYPAAVLDAIEESGLVAPRVPSICPFTATEILG